MEVVFRVDSIPGWRSLSGDLRVLGGGICYCVMHSRTNVSSIVSWVPKTLINSDSRCAWHCPH